MRLCNVSTFAGCCVSKLITLFDLVSKILQLEDVMLLRTKNRDLVLQYFFTEEGSSATVLTFLGSVGESVL